MTLHGNLLAAIRRRARVQRARRVLFWGGLVFLLYVFIGGPYGLIKYQKLGAQEHRLQEEQRRMTADIADLELEISRLKDDTLYIEKVARERYGYARPDERVYHITPH